MLFDNFWFFYYHIVHILIKALFFCFLSLELLDVYFRCSLYTSNNKIELFYKQTKIFNELLKSLIFLFLLSYSFSSLFIKTTSLWLIFESIKTLEFNTSILFNFDFASNTIYHGFFLFLIYCLMHFSSCSYCTSF